MTNEEMLNLLSHKGNEIQNYAEIASHPSLNSIIKKTTPRNAGGGGVCGEKEPSYTVGGNVK
jgi:hypothetical protein